VRLAARVIGPASPWLRVPVGIPLELWRRPVDLLHLQTIAPPICSTPFVLTINDLAWETNPDVFPWSIRQRLKVLVRRDARRAARVITVSEHTKRLICERYGLDPERVAVAHHGAGERFRPIDDPAGRAAVRARYGISDDYLLYVGKIQARKNLVRLLEAFDRVVRARGFPHRLVLVGRRTWMSDETFDAIRRLPTGDRVVITGEVPADDLVQLYNGATALAFPSLAEGFGLPPLEAMACGTPVVSSNATSLPEVVGDAALLFDPYDVDGLAEALATVMGSIEVRRTLAEQGLRQAARFSNRRMAEQTLGVYEAVLRDSR
jgi:glycosyltransferase involved in cell wall biosynthesis